MILRDLYLYPDLVEFETDFTGQFRYETRPLCHYVGRMIAKLRFRTDNFTRVCIVLCGSKPTDEVIINSGHALAAHVQFDVSEYELLANDELQEYFIHILTKGLEKTAKSVDIPLQQYLETIEDFRAGGYKDEWTHIRRQFNQWGIKCALECSMTMDYFVLEIVVLRGKTEIFRDEVMRTGPDEIHFAPFFKDVVAINDQIQVVDRFGRIVYQMDPTTLSA